MFGKATGPHQRPIQREPEIISTAVKRPKREAYHSHLYNAVVMNEWRYTSTPSTSLHDGPMDNFAFFSWYLPEGTENSHTDLR